MSHSQDMICTLYGDYIRHRGGEAWTGSLIELLDLFRLSGQAVRSTLSRVSRKGWLKSRKVGRNSYYSLTLQSIELLEEGAVRIFQPRHDPWDGQWHLLTYSIPESKRHLRRRLRRRLIWLSFGALNHAAWISPRDQRVEVEQLSRAWEWPPTWGYSAASIGAFAATRRSSPAAGTWNGSTTTMQPSSAATSRCSRNAGHGWTTATAWLRVPLLLAGLPHSVAGVTLNRLCASGLDAINQALRGGLDAGLAFELEAVTQTFGTEGQTQGMAGFLERRRPEFKGP